MFILIFSDLESNKHKSNEAPIEINYLKRLSGLDFRVLNGIQFFKLYFKNLFKTIKLKPKMINAINQRQQI